MHAGNLEIAVMDADRVSHQGRTVSCVVSVREPCLEFSLLTIILHVVNYLQPAALTVVVRLSVRPSDTWLPPAKERNVVECSKFT